LKNIFLTAKLHFKSKNDLLVERALEEFKKNPFKFLSKQSIISKELFKRNKEVLEEILKLKAFTRFQHFPEMLLFAEANPKHDTINFVLNYFSEKFPTFIIAFFVNNKLLIKTKRKDVFLPKEKNFFSKNQAIEWARIKIREQLSERILLSIEWMEKYWSKYYDSQFIESRKNLKLAKQLMPLKFLEKQMHETKALKKAKNLKPNTSLKDFE
jgi:probable DNA metabolism protein